MTTRMPKKDNDTAVSLGGLTEYQLYKNFAVDGNRSSVIDYSEYRLCKLLERVKDKKVQTILQTLFEDYRGGRAAVAWRSGLPCYLPVKSGK